MSEKSGFQFEDYVIRKSVFIINGKSDKHYETKINPSGIIHKNKKQFQLSLDIIVSDKDENHFINIESVALFTYKGDIQKIWDYFLTNAPAILFPYLRAYISSLTALSGTDTIILPTMNLTGLKQVLEENIQLIEE
ncbi:MAG: protein export chaperone secb [Marinilabiliales bacterium]|nr:MAG: protein export chaperone secb [Marinilabiliales bacterium]